MRKRPLTLLSLPLLVGAVLLAAGCGGTSNSTASAAASSGSTAAAGQTTTNGSAGRGFGGFTNAKFTACLKDQGVTLPTRPALPQGNGQAPSGQTRRGGGFFNNSDPKLRAAFEKCRQYLPNGGRFRGGAGGRPGVNSAAFAKYRQCLTQHGVKLTGGGPFGGANVASPAFQAAAKACRQYAPQRGGAPPAASGQTTTP